MDRKREIKVRRKPTGASRIFLAMIVLSLLFPLWAGNASASQASPDIMDPMMIPKWVNQLSGPPPVWEETPEYDPETGALMYNYVVSMVDNITEQILPAPLPMTHVWGYAGSAKDAVTGESLGYVASSPGASFEARRGEPIQVKWVNEVDSPHMFAVDPTLHWANPNGMEMPEAPFPPYPSGFADAQYPVALVTHLHGGEVQSTSDGGPNAWFTASGIHGANYSSAIDVPDSNWAIYTYPNEQPATTLWYHDHALGVTRINVMSGLAGFYLLRDSNDTIAPMLPQGKYDMPIVIQDRTFTTNGSLWFDTVGVNPDIHPYWMPEFFGNTIMVNGKVWPNMNVDKGVYLFRLLDGSNARFYTLSLQDSKSQKLIPFTVIGSDGGYLQAPATITKLTIAPGERYNILVDFSALAPGSKVIMKNTAKAPFPSGSSANGATTGRIMQFTVTGTPGSSSAALPSTLNAAFETFPSLNSTVDKTRYMVLTEVMGELGPSEILLNGLKWHFNVTEKPVVGTTEEWVIINPTEDAHPIHLHLTQFQLVSRQSVDIKKYYADWLALQSEEMGMDAMPPFCMEPMSLNPSKYLRGQPSAANPWERGWKDTVQVMPGEVTIIRVRFAATATPIGGSIDSNGNYPFDPTIGPGYVWHCHIIDHEDNEMMRPYLVTRPT